MDSTGEILSDRGCIEVTGADRLSFLQGLVTNDVEGLADGEAAFSALLSPQGKILFDFLIVKLPDRIFLDCLLAAVPDIVKRLGFYQLRANVKIESVADRTAIAASWGEQGTRPVGGGEIVAYRDPRFEGLGSRAILETDRRSDAPGNSSQFYENHRIAAAMPECGKDYGSGEVFAHDACLDLLHGVDFKKGCYVGQEVVSRMQHRGTARTRVLSVRGAADLPADRPDVTAEEFPVGKLGAVSGTNGIALLRLDRVKDAFSKGEALKAGGVQVNVTVPKWAPYSLDD